MQDKRFGYFDDDNREYVITDPKTPWPWINYLGNEDFFSLISNTAGGYSFYKDAKFRRITRYRYNNVPMDNGGRYFYINEGGNVWSPTWKPCKTALDSYECRHGMSYTRITGSKDGIEASLLFFVPLKTWGEVQKLTLRNTSAKVRKLKLFSFAEWCCGMPLRTWRTSSVTSPRERWKWTGLSSTTRRNTRNAAITTPSTVSIHP